MPVPASLIAEVPAGPSLAPSSSPRACVTFGTSSKGPINVPTPFNAGSPTLKNTFGCGPGVKASAYVATKTGADGIFIRLAKTIAAAFKSAITATGTGTSVATVAGTPLARFDVLLVFTVGGTVGTAGASWKISLDGGGTFTAPVALGTATTITPSGTGLTITLGTGTLVANDTRSFYTLPASQSVLPLTITRAATSTCVVTETAGLPEDAYHVLFEVLTGGTIGVAGITVRYSLDNGETYSAETALGTATTFALLDGAEPAGLTLAFAAGTLDVGDVVSFLTTAPTWQASDAIAALAVLRAGNLRWSFLHAVGDLDPGSAGSLGSVMTGWAAKNKFAWLAGSVREWGVRSNEPETAWISRLLASWSSFADTRTAIGAGYTKITCPITGRRNRRSCTWAAVARWISIAPQIDLGEKATGVLSSDITLHEDGLLTEHDAENNSALHDARFVTLRSWPDEPGVWFTSGNLMGPDSDIQLVAYRRVLNIAEEVFQKAMRETIKSNLAREPSTAKLPKVPGNLKEPDCQSITQRVTNALKSQIVTTGMAPGVTFVLNKTPIQTGQGKWRISGKVSIDGFIYVDSTLGEISFTDPQLDAIFNKPAGA
jgi:hypothetical protein